MIKNDNIENFKERSKKNKIKQKVRAINLYDKNIECDETDSKHNYTKSNVATFNILTHDKFVKNKVTTKPENEKIFEQRNVNKSVPTKFIESTKFMKKNKMNIMPVKQQVRASSTETKVKQVSLPVIQPTNKYAIVITFKHTSDDRLENLLFVINWIMKTLNNFKLYIVETDIDKKIEKYIEKKDNIEYIYLYNNNFFNRGWAFNCAIKHYVKENTVIVSDADILLPKSIESHLQLISSGSFFFISPYAKIYGTNNDEKKIIIKTESISSINVSTADKFGCFSITGGVLLLNKSKFIEVGGYEEYCCYGYEDRAFDVIILNTFGKKVKIINDTYIHLHHSVAEKNKVSDQIHVNASHCEKFFGCTNNKNNTTDIHQFCNHVKKQNTDKIIQYRKQHFGNQNLYKKRTPISLNSIAKTCTIVYDANCFYKIKNIENNYSLQVTKKVCINDKNLQHIIKNNDSDILINLTKSDVKKYGQNYNDSIVTIRNNSKTIFENTPKKYFEIVTGNNTFCLVNVSTNKFINSHGKLQNDAFLFKSLDNIIINDIVHNVKLEIKTPQLVNSYNNVKYKNNYESFKKIIENKKVVIVGPSPYLTNKHIGKIIDQYDVIVRMNKGYKLVNDKNNYGSRTDILYHTVNQNEENGGALSEDLINEYNIKSVRGAYPCLHKSANTTFKNVGTLIDYVNLPENINFSPIDYSKYVTYETESGTRPNTGSISILDILSHNPLELYITGFTLFKDGYNKLYRNKIDGIELGNDNGAKQVFDRMKNSCNHDQEKIRLYYKKNLLGKKNVKMDDELLNILID